jgi:hypothetical protein
MGWGRMLLLGNLGQQLDIEEQREELENIRRQLEQNSATGNTTPDNRIAQLEKENSELRLYLVALIRYLGHKGVLQENEFRRLVEAIDIEDGSADSGYRGKIIK